ncbi:flavin-containing monooxygenase [Streptomyces sp. NBC_00887]|uniref:flavin-containing monooxygenase n=1 Tax=Streptomyces sp. NBC_00887 TaxID=2975859 RepID=UPI003869B96D|nr:NAD(P)/FAD-dependent oxidoreductase [Streptomyces sp. NBC_00887]
MSDTDTDTECSAVLDAVVVGAGFAGLYQLHRLDGLGLRVRVFEAGDDVGGTWYWNRYPGARCDIESMAYSYSFSPELEQEWQWSERYATQPELLSYIRHVVERFDLRRHITFGAAVTRALYDRHTHTWTVTTDSGEEVTARFVIMATGCLSRVSTPDLPGRDRYRGPVHHTGRWPHEPVDLTGRRVAVIGTGSSGIQLIPLVAEQAAEVTVFQRTPTFSTPARNRPLTREESDERKVGYGEFREWLRTTSVGIPRPLPVHSALEVSADEREAAYRSAWDAGVLGGIQASFTDTLTSRRANDLAAEFVRSKIRQIVHDPQTASVLCPTGFPLGTKRPCLDTDYYATFNLPHVRLVDLRKTPLVSFTERGVETTEGEYEADVVVLATGFDAMTGALRAIDVRGRDGVALRDAWAAGPRTYLGLLTAGFPNLFTVTGPLSPSVLSNMLISIEQHVEWITDCIGHLRSHALTEIDATDEAQDDWVRHVADLAAGTLYPEGASWYQGANIPGKPQVFMPYVGGIGAYREVCAAVADTGYRGFALSRLPDELPRT